MRIVVIIMCIVKMSTFLPYIPVDINSSAGYFKFHVKQSKQFSHA